MKGLHVKGEGRREKGELTATGLEGRVIVITGAVNLNGTILGSQAAW